MTDKIRITLSDDHPIMIAGLRNLIQQEPDFELVGEATNGTAALKLVREQKPDVAILDISMPELNGIMVARKLTEELPDVKLMVLTLHEDRAYLRQALDVGVRGYVLKRSAAENLVQAIRAVVVGGLYVDPAIVDRVFEKNVARGGRSAAGSNMPQLTDREGEVLRLTALGFTNKEAARRLDLGVKSVETYQIGRAHV